MSGPAKGLLEETTINMIQSNRQYTVYRELLQNVSARPVSVASDGDCMANTKENLFPDGLNTTPKKKINVAVNQVLKCSCVFADNM